ncbi:helix-turn-helix transcriptional regulator [Bifidobacterium sp.]|uniref:helix-turn-helix transcriptional regulator n=1 Tax=Bifidobacterium sp. TaxID=41200 RepID=UPI003D7CDAB1
MGLRELRLKRGMTQKQLADKAGLSQQRVGAFETGQRKVSGMSLDVAIRICDALHVSNPRKLLEDDKD